LSVLFCSKQLLPKRTKNNTTGWIWFAISFFCQAVFNERSSRTLSKQHKVYFFENQRLTQRFDRIVLLTLGYKPTDRKEKLQTFPSAWVLFLVGFWR
jgi:hypothetical protein